MHQPFLIVGSDHSGLKLKKVIINHLHKLGISVQDLGETSTVASDYPDVAARVCQEVLRLNTLGILVCGTGIGMSIAANRIPNIRAALCTNTYEARMSREHNNANILCLGKRVIGEQLALEIVDGWLNAHFSKEDRHIRRVKKIEDVASKVSIIAPKNSCKKQMSSASC